VRSGESLAALYQAQLAPPGSEIAARMSPRLLGRYAWAMLSARDPVKASRKIGRMAMSARTVPPEQRRAVIAARLPVHQWPAAKLQITAVDAVTGELTIFDAASGADLVDAVGASCAVPGIWPPVTIAGRTYIDGGIRSPANADLAAGYQSVVVIAPLTRGFGHQTSVASQVAQLRRTGALVAVIEPDAAAVRAIGRNVLDPARRPAAARAGHAQAAQEAQAAAAAWQ